MSPSIDQRLSASDELVRRELAAADDAINDHTPDPPRPGPAKKVVSASSDVLRHPAWGALAGWLAVRQRSFRPLVSVAAAQLGCVTVARATKMVVERPRPAPGRPEKPTASAGKKFSFPSGHATTAFASAAALAPYSRAGFWLFGPAAGVALGRLYLMVHHPTDVLGGAVLGGGVGTVAGRALHRRGSTSKQPGRVPLAVAAALASGTAAWALQAKADRLEKVAVGVGKQVSRRSRRLIDAAEPVTDGVETAGTIASAVGEATVNEVSRATRGLPRLRATE